MVIVKVIYYVKHLAQCLIHTKGLIIILITVIIFSIRKDMQLDIYYKNILNYI